MPSEHISLLAALLRKISVPLCWMLPGRIPRQECPTAICSISGTLHRVGQQVLPKRYLVAWITIKGHCKKELLCTQGMWSAFMLWHFMIPCCPAFSSGFCSLLQTRTDGALKDKGRARIMAPWRQCWGEPLVESSVLSLLCYELKLQLWARHSIFSFLELKISFSTKIDPVKCTGGTTSKIKFKRQAACYSLNLFIIQTGKGLVSLTKSSYK